MLKILRFSQSKKFSHTYGHMYTYISEQNLQIRGGKTEIQWLKYLKLQIF